MITFSCSAWNDDKKLRPFGLKCALSASKTAFGDDKNGSVNNVYIYIHISIYNVYVYIYLSTWMSVSVWLYFSVRLSFYIHLYLLVSIYLYIITTIHLNIKHIHNIRINPQSHLYKHNTKNKSKQKTHTNKTQDSIHTQPRATPPAATQVPAPPRL